MIAASLGKFLSQRRLRTLAILLTVTLTASPALAQQSGGALHAAIETNPPTLDVMTTATGSTRVIAAHVLESLVTYSEDFEVIPMLASGWEISEDNRTYTFDLRPNVKFHNGETMTSADVKASHERFFELSTRRGRFENVASIDAVDPLRVVFNLSEPDATFLPALASTFSWAVIMPSSVLETLSNTDFRAENLIGTGPYRLAAWQPDVHVHLTRFEEYSADTSRDGSGLGGAKTAYFDDIYIEFVPEQGTRVAGLITGDYDYAAALPPTQIAQFEGDPNVETLVVSPGTMPRFEFNHANQWSSDLAFRQAVQAALDMEEIMEGVTGGHSELYDLNPSIMFRQQVWWNDGGAELYNQADPERARELLESIGYAGEEIVMLTTRDYEDYFRATLIASEQLKQAGFNVSLRVMDFPGQRAFEARETDWHVSVTAGSIRFDPSDWDGTFHSSARRKFYANAEMDRLLELARSTSDFDERYAYYVQVQQLFYQDVNAIKLGDVFTVDGARTNLEGYRSWDIPRFWNVWRD